MFPEVRLKKILEVRGADAVSPAAAMALNAFWVGALYDPETMEALETLSRTWSVADLQDVQRRVPREGRAALFQGRTCHEWLRLALDEVTQSLVRRGKGEDRFLIPLRDVLTQQPSFADQTRACFDSTQSWEAVLKLNQWHNESAETV